VFTGSATYQVELACGCCWEARFASARICAASEQRARELLLEAGPVQAGAQAFRDAEARGARLRVVVEIRGTAEPDLPYESIEVAP